MWLNMNASSVKKEKENLPVVKFDLLIGAKAP